MRFSWDEAKDRANRRKHGVAFDVAERVFADLHRKERYDDRHDEDRWITIGAVERDILVVVYTIRDELGEVIRLISGKEGKCARERVVS